MTDIPRRSVLAGGAGAAMYAGATALSGTAAPARAETAPEDAFGLVGDGVADDTDALQQLLDAAFAGAEARLVDLPPGVYRVTRPLEVVTAERPAGNITHAAGVKGRGARIVSEIDGDRPILRIEARATLRYILLEGLTLEGSGQDGTGLEISCQTRGTYFYNFCLRDIVVESCGGDGCRLIGNVFEGQIVNAYFRDNGRDGAVFSHGAEDTVFSAVHVFASVFGGNHRNGVSLDDGARDASFHGCYFLLNGRFGLSAETGVTLLSHCGFENNHERAESFDDGDAGLRLLVGGTLVACTAYSIYNQRALVRAYVTNRLVLLGCTGSGDDAAGAAGLAEIDGTESAAVTLIGSYGEVASGRDVDLLEFGSGAGVRFGRRWDSPNLLRLGDFRVWIDADGRLRTVEGPPQSDDDGAPVGG